MVSIAATITTSVWEDHEERCGWRLLTEAIKKGIAGYTTAERQASGVEEASEVFEDELTMRDGVLTLKDRIFSMFPRDKYTRGERVRVRVERIADLERQARWLGC